VEIVKRANLETEKLITQAEVQSFVGANIVSADNKRLECGDGRYTPDQSVGAIRILGGDFGAMLAFAGAARSKNFHINKDALISSYLEAVKADRGEDPKLYLHLDTSHDIHKGEIGCGHAKYASDPQNEGKYGLTSTEAKELFNTALARPEANVTILEGGHKEKAVLRVKGMNGETVAYGVNSTDEGGSNMFFVIDDDRIKQHFEKITPKMSRVLGIGIKSEEVLESYISQMGVTSGFLADSLDTYNIEINNLGQPTVTKSS
jgi:hypothetical protein